MKLYIFSVIFILVNFGTFAETLSDSLLCNKATMQKGDITSWDTSNQFRFEYVMEAKKRGLDCGVDKIKIDMNTDFLEDDELCYRATYQIQKQINWDTSNENRKEYVKAAKKRGLECGISKSTSKLGNLDYKVVCYEATELVNDTFVWDNNKLDYVKEAKRRGLDCEVKNTKVNTIAKVKKPNPTTNTSNVKTKKPSPSTTSSNVKNKSANLKQDLKKNIFLNPNAYTDWIPNQNKNEMTGVENFYIFTNWASAKYPMSFPYNKTESLIGIACNKNSFWAYFNFTKAPNITNDETKDGYNKIITRIKFDDNLENIGLTQDWGSKSLFIENVNAFLKSIENTNEITLELSWYGNSSVYFRYFTEEALQAIKSLKYKCGY